jgi:hypothetical protein
MLLTILYDVVEPARVRALQEMHLLATGPGDDADIRSRLTAYLSEGPLTGILFELSTATSVDMRRATALIDTVAAEDPQEWVGAAARQLEAYPDHPVLLLVRAAGEAVLPRPDGDLVYSTFRKALESSESYGVPADDRVWMFAWAAAQLRNLRSGSGWQLVPLLYRAWDDAHLDPDALSDLEERVLTNATRGLYHPNELREILRRRVTRTAPLAAKLVDDLVGEVR